MKTIPTSLTSALVIMAMFSLAMSFHLDSEQFLAKPDHLKADHPNEATDFLLETKHPHQHHHKRRTPAVPDFVSSQVVAGGLREEVRVSRAGVLALESLIPSVEEAGLFLRQVNRGRHLVQLIYTDSEGMVDCDVSKDDHTLDNFLERFLGADWLSQGDLDLDRGQVVGHLQAMRGQNVSIQFLGSGDQLEDKYSALMDIDALIEECRGQHHAIREEIKQGKRPGHLHPRKEEEDEFEDEDEDLDEDEENEVIKHHHGHLKNVTQDQQLEEHHRSKRFIYPGTNWCGKGTNAAGFRDLGKNRRTDRCCRTHDHCPHFIEGFETKYNYFNLGLHTMSHCKCDMSFRNCLRRVKTPASDMVGQIFFNIMGKNCFVLKKHKMCVKRSWWGKCIKYRKKRSATIQNAVNF